jgi:hypothetical protein
MLAQRCVGMLQAGEPVMSQPESVPKAMQEKYDEIVAISDAFCNEHLDEGYAALSRKMAATLARKRPSPLAKGRAKTWACGIVYTLGSINFLSDPNTQPYMRLEDVCEKMGVGKSTGSAKATEIRNMLDLFQFHPEWTVSGMVDQNPMIWFLSVDGLIVDIRREPREVQEVAYRQGLIPYIPADQQS